MSKDSRNTIAHTKLNELGPDYLGYYKHIISELLSKEDEFLSPSSRLVSESLDGTCSKRDVSIFSDSDKLFGGGVVEGLSDFQNERLKALLNQSVASLSQETDEILDCISAIFQIKADLREPKSFSCYASASDKDMSRPLCSKKQKLLSKHCDGLANAEKSASARQVYRGFQDLIENGRLQPQEAVEKCSDDVFSKLGKMELNLEEFLDVTMSKCRPMSCAEKQQLGRRIHKLPMKAVDRVAEIIKHRNFSARHQSDKIDVNFDEEDDVTLWRLYYYVETVRKANKLSL